MFGHKKCSIKCLSTTRKVIQGSCIFSTHLPSLFALVFSSTTEPEQRENFLLVAPPIRHLSAWWNLTTVPPFFCFFYPLGDGRKDLESLVRAWYVLAISVPWRWLITSKKEIRPQASLHNARSRSRKLEADRQLPSLMCSKVTTAKVQSTFCEHFSPHIPPEGRQT